MVDKWPDFAFEYINLNLALSANGINPHSSLQLLASCPYNLQSSSMVVYEKEIHDVFIVDFHTTTTR